MWSDSYTVSTTVLIPLSHFIPQVSEMCQQMKEQVYTEYENNSSNMQVKLQELTEVLERCAKLNNELTEATQALGTLRGGLAINQTSEK